MNTESGKFQTASYTHIYFFLNTPAMAQSFSLFQTQLIRASYLFMNQQTGKPYVTISKVWVRLRKKAGLPHLRLHDLRHQFASFLVNDGRTLYEVQQIPEHSDPKGVY